MSHLPPGHTAPEAPPSSSFCCLQQKGSRYTKCLARVTPLCLHFLAGHRGSQWSLPHRGCRDNYKGKEAWYTASAPYRLACGSEGSFTPPITCRVSETPAGTLSVSISLGLSPSSSLGEPWRWCHMLGLARPPSSSPRRPALIAWPRLVSGHLEGPRSCPKSPLPVWVQPPSGDSPLSVPPPLEPGTEIVTLLTLGEWPWKYFRAAFSA